MTPRPWIAAGIVVLGGGAAALAWLGSRASTWRAALGAPEAPPLALALALAALLVADLAGGRWARRFVRALGASVLGGLAGLFLYTVGYFIAADPPLLDPKALAALARDAALSATPLEGLCILIGASVGALLSGYSWRLHGTTAYVALLSVIVGYLLHAFTVALPSVPSSALPLSIALIAAETASLVMVAVHAFYALDVASRTRWRRSSARVAFSRYFRPKVAFHVAIYNEPPDIVLASLDALRTLDYPKDRLMVLVLDDSTDPACSEPIRRYCAANGMRYHHRVDRRGFKAGALNEGLRLTPPDCDLIAVLDADFQVDPEFLRDTVGHFIDPRLGFLQTPQDYRNGDHSFLTRQYRHADAYFYRAVLPSRNETNAIIFCGTMGILRRAAIDEAGGWGEAFLCEDAELSVRILGAGYDALYVNRTYGRGLIPPTFDAYQKQHHRWAYGGAQILRGHGRRILFGRMSVRQKVDFLVGNLHWFEGVSVVVMAAALAAIAVGDLMGAPLVTHHRSDIWLLALVPLLLLVDGVVRLHVAMRRATNAPVTSTLAVMGMWMSVKFNTTWAALKAATGMPLAFARTPKAPERRIGRVDAARRAVRLTPWESAASLALLTLSGLLVASMAKGAAQLADARALLAVWLAFYALLFGCAPLYAYRSYTSVTQGVAAPASVPAPADAVAE